MTNDLANVATAATHTYGDLPHQMEAFDYLQSVLTPKEHFVFTEMFRDDPTSPVEPFEPSSEFTQWITPHIQYGEICIWNEARRFRHQYQCDAAVELCEFLEQVRTKFNSNPIIITSGHRPEPINSQVGGAPNSEHTYNKAGKGAIDFCVERTNIYEVEKYVDDNWPYSVGYGASRGFVHLGNDGYNTRKRWYY